MVPLRHRPDLIGTGSRDTPFLRKLIRRNPRVSIVMFRKDGMPFVCEAVASFQAQTREDFEIDIQDAVSTDGTADFLRGLRDPRVSMLSEPDAGLGDAYNRAFLRCQGEIVRALDSDNLLRPNALWDARCGLPQASIYL